MRGECVIIFRGGGAVHGGALHTEALLPRTGQRVRRGSLVYLIKFLTIEFVDS